MSSLHRAEGFGLGMAEAMKMGKPVIATDYSGNTDFTLPDNACLVGFSLIDVQPGENYDLEGDSVWADPDVEEAAEHMRFLATDRAAAAALGERGRQQIEGVPQLSHRRRELPTQTGPDRTALVQIVYISNRPEIARGTLEGVAVLMPFIDQAWIVCPGSQVSDFGPSAGPLDVTTIAEEDLLGDSNAHFAASTDHQTRNWLLRASLPKLGDLDVEYLMSDDDSRPLREIPRELFVEDGRHHAFFTHDLSRWLATATDYDAGQHQTRQVLEGRDLPTLSYSAHMPQVIDKALYAEVVGELEGEIARGLALDEWSLYFNIARTRHPERFHPPRPFETLCWPALPTDWETGARPENFSFENYYPPLYGSGGLFEGIPQGFDPSAYGEHTAQKIERRLAVQRVYDSPVARLLRRSAWLLHNSTRRMEAGLAHSSALRLARRLAPRGLRRWLRDAARHGDDPAWSFPSALTRYPCRRSREEP